MSLGENGGRFSCQSVAFWYAAAIANKWFSSKARPTKTSDVGRPASPKPFGTQTEGRPQRLPPPLSDVLRKPWPYSPKDLSIGGATVDRVGETIASQRERIASYSRWATFRSRSALI